MWARKQGDRKRMEKLLGFSGGYQLHRKYRPCGAYYNKRGVLVRFYKSDRGTYKFFKKQAARSQRHKEKRTLEKWPRRLFDPSWRYY